MKQTKITVKIYQPLITGFNKQLDRLFIRRDAFLNHVIKVETPYLLSDLKDKRLSVVAKRHIAGELKRLGTVAVNIVVDQSVADELKAVVDSTNLVRDAFINRLLLLLMSRENLLTYFGLPHFITGSAFDSVVEPMPTSPLSAMGEVYLDPLHYLRAACEERHNEGLYLLDLPEKMHGFACFLEDAVIPGTESNAKMLKDAVTWLDELDSFEAKAFQNSEPIKGV